MCKSSHLIFATTQDCQDRAQPCLYLIDLKPRGLTNLFKVSKWQSQDLAAKALEDLLQNVTFARAVPHFRFLLVVSWHLSFLLDAFFFFSHLAVLCDMRDLSSPIRDQTRDPSSGSAWVLNHWTAKKFPGSHYFLLHHGRCWGFFVCFF